MKNLKPPQFLENLARDMRDRHMLLPALALVIGMLAVPIVLKSHSDAHKVAAQSASAGTQADSVTPAVVTKQLGVTNYKKRLNEQQSKNPFDQKYTSTPESAQAQASPSASAPSTSSTSTATAPPAATTSPVPPVSSSTSSAGTPVTSPPETSSGGSTSATPHHHTKPGLRYYAWRVSVKVGEPNHLKERPEVQRLALLPSDARPVVSFLGATEDGSKAVFLVSPDVDSVSGEGHCLPSHSSCQYYVMKPGDKAHFHYAPNHTRYNLILLDIHPVDVTDKLPKKPTGQAEPQRKVPLLGAG